LSVDNKKEELRLKIQSLDFDIQSNEALRDQAERDREHYVGLLIQLHREREKYVDELLTIGIEEEKEAEEDRPEDAL